MGRSRLPRLNHWVPFVWMAVLVPAGRVSVALTYRNYLEALKTSLGLRYAARPGTGAVKNLPNKPDAGIR